MVKKRKVLITGGTGFIGSHLVNSFVDNNYDVISISKKEPKKNQYNFQAKYIKHDLTKSISLEILKKISSIDYIINCCGYVDHRGYKDGGLEVFESHTKSIYNLTKLAFDTNIKTFISLGSSDEYGDIKSPISEDNRESPISPYSLSKLTSTHYLQQISRNESLPVIILRPFLIFGENQATNRFLPYIIKNCINNKSCGVTEGIQIRDYCYIKDFTSAVKKSIDNKSAFGEVINIASGKPISIKEVTNMVIKIIGKGEAHFGEIEYRKSESMSLYADISKAAKLLDWHPKYDFKESLLKVIEWYKKNG